MQLINATQCLVWLLLGEVFYYVRGNSKCYQKKTLSNIKLPRSMLGFLNHDRGQAYRRCDKKKNYCLRHNRLDIFIQGNSSRFKCPARSPTHILSAPQSFKSSLVVNHIITPPIIKHHMTHVWRYPSHPPSFLISLIFLKNPSYTTHLLNPT